MNNFEIDKKQFTFKYNDKNSKILIITGPRSVGKTTLAKQFYDSIGIDFLDLDDLVNENLSEFFKSGSKTPLEQAMEAKKYDLIESIVRDIVQSFDSLKQATAIAFAGGAYSGYKGLSEDLKSKFITTALIPYDKDDELSIKLLIERESNREHFKKLINEGKLDMETLSNRVRNDYIKVNTYLRLSTVDKLIFIQQKTPIEIMSEMLDLLK